MSTMSCGLEIPGSYFLSLILTGDYNSVVYRSYLGMLKVLLRRSISQIIHSDALSAKKKTNIWSSSAYGKISRWLKITEARRTNQTLQNAYIQFI